MLLAGWYDELIMVVIGMVLVVVGITLALLLRHGTISIRARSDRHRVKRLLPVICSWLCDPERRQEPLEAIRRSDHRAILPVLVQLSLDFRGEESRLIGELAERLGLARSESRRLRAWRLTERAEAAKNLGLLRVNSALPALLRLVKSDRHFEVRHAGVWALGEIGGDEAILGLLTMLEDPHPGVVRRAQELLLEAGSGCAGKVIDYARRSRIASARRAAIELLGVLRDPIATPLLLELVDDGDPELRIKAIKAAASIADPRALAAFQYLLSDPVWQIRCQAANGLGALGNNNAIPGLRSALSDAQWWVRFNSARALYELGEGGRRVLDEVSRDRESTSGEVARYVLERADSNRIAA